VGSLGLDRSVAQTASSLLLQNHGGQNHGTVHHFALHDFAENENRLGRA
jgi:hypothetical protein